MKKMVLAKQEHFENGSLSDEYLTQVFDALIQGKELYLDSKLFKGLEISKETVKIVKQEKKVETLEQKLNRLLEKECSVAGTYMNVETETFEEGSNWTFAEYIFSGVAFDYQNHTIGSLGFEMVENGTLTERQLNSYLNKLKKFIMKNGEKYCTPEYINGLLKDLN